MKQKLKILSYKDGEERLNLLDPILKTIEKEPNLYLLGRKKIIDFVPQIGSLEEIDEHMTSDLGRNHILASKSKLNLIVLIMKSIRIQAINYRKQLK
jgi:hypothetical protein